MLFYYVHCLTVLHLCNYIDFKGATSHCSNVWVQGESGSCSCLKFAKQTQQCMVSAWDLSEVNAKNPNVQFLLPGIV